MWGISRSQSSYNSGIWTMDKTTIVENQDMFWMPLNPITEYLFYVHPISNKNQRIIVSAPTANPTVWKISKVLNYKPLGIQKLTLFQDVWNSHTDYIDYDEIANGDIYAMYADYYDSEISPTEPTPTPSTIHGKITASTSTIKVGGSYKTLTLKLYDADDNEITDNYSDAEFLWTCSITDGDETTILTDTVKWLDGSSFNQKKIKFPDDRQYLNQLLDITCTVDGIETTAQFELVI